MNRLGIAVLCGWLCIVSTSNAAAQAVEGSGFELALHGSTRAQLGGVVRVEGVAYAVRRLADLTPVTGAEIIAKVTHLRDRDRTVERVTLTTITVRTTAGGHFSVAIDAPRQGVSDPRLELTVRERAGSERTFAFPLQLEQAARVDVLTDRVRYEPGETMHAWARIVRRDDGAPVAGQTVRIRVMTPDGGLLSDQTTTSGPSGAVSSEAPIPNSATDGAYTVSVEAPGVYGNRVVQVGRRTVERLLATATIDQEIVAPGGRVTGRVTARTPSGAPVPRAHVTITMSGASEPTELETDGEGRAQFDVAAPAYLAGSTTTIALAVRVLHPAHGTAYAQASFVLARVEWIATAKAQNGALVPETDSALFLSVADPRGRPAPANTAVVARGLAIRDGAQRAQTDANGIAVIPVRVPRNAAALVGNGGLGCDGQTATTFDVEIATAHPVTARLCAVVALDAEVSVRALNAVIAPAAELGFDVQRRDSARGRAVIAEALSEGRAVGWTWVAPTETRGVITLPPAITGVVTVRARPVTPEGTLRPTDEVGATLLGVGSSDAVLVRPADAFALTADPGADVYHVRTTARIGLRESAPARQAWAAVVVRDLAMHGGEPPWDLAWMATALDRAVLAPGSEDAGNLVRAALATLVSADPKGLAPPPLRPPIWRRGQWQQPWTPGFEVQRGMLRDPIAMREELRRRQIPQQMVELENVIAALDANGPDARGVLLRQGARVTFDPQVIANLVRARRWGARLNLGGSPLELAMMVEADPSFTFDNVARRVARRRLLTLLAAIATLTNPDDENAQRASSSEPPERWLGKLTQLGLVAARELVDPWGRPFQLRNAGTRGAAVVVAQRAPDFELVSAGPDGVFGNGDDVRDPFARVLPRGAPYAVASGEDTLMESLAALGPSATVLAKMQQAYLSVSIDARDETRRSVVTAAASEATVMAPMEAEAPAAMDELLDGAMAQGRAAGGYAMRGPAPASPAPPPPPAQRMRARAEANEPADNEESAREQDARQDTGGSRLEVAGELIRERFPATLFFAGDASLDASGATVLEVPLADALTTYRIEVIAWTASGWVTTARTEARVDQDAVVDAPVPPFATEGDVIRVPVRIGNRTNAALSARVEVSAEGGLSITAPPPQAIEVPARDAVEVLAEVRVGSAAEGALVVRAVGADGAPLDAVRRPMRVLPDARLVRGHADVVVRGSGQIRFTLPAEATARGPASLRIATGSRVFGDPLEWGPREDPSLAAWSLLTAGEDVPEVLRERSRAVLSGSGEDELWASSASDMGLHVGVAWSDPQVDEGRLRAGLRAITRAIEQSIVEYGDVRVSPDPPAEILIALSPALRTEGLDRGAAQADLALVVNRLRTSLEEATAETSDDPVAHATGALALLVTGTGPQPRAEELLRRAERGVFKVGDVEWIESPGLQASVAHARIAPTVALGLARALSRGPEAALPCLRAIAELRRGMASWTGVEHAGAAALAGVVSGGAVALDAVRIEADGRPVTTRTDAGVLVADVDGVGTPGAHAISLTLPGGAVAVATVELRYGLPWTARAPRALPAELSLDGELGARDGRAALTLEVRNRGTRVLSRPVVEIDLPAGSELDERARESLAALLRTPVTIEGRVLRLSLRPLTPGGHVRLPIPVRWSLGGTLRGLGAVLVDEAMPDSLDGRPAAVSVSRAVEIADTGAEPTQAEPEASPPLSPPPIPLPPPILPLGAEVLR